MRAIGIRELKNRLSEYVRLVRQGEHVQVTPVMRASNPFSTGSSLSDNANCLLERKPARVNAPRSVAGRAKTKTRKITRVRATAYRYAFLRKLWCGTQAMPFATIVTRPSSARRHAPEPAVPPSSSPQPASTARSNTFWSSANTGSLSVSSGNLSVKIFANCCVDSRVNGASPRRPA